MTAGWLPAGDRPLRVGLAGLGSMGQNHLRVLGEHRGVELVAVADPVATSLDAATARSGGQGFASPIAMVREAGLDAVVIAAPTTAHMDIALAAVEAGVAVLVEKPLAATVADGLEIVRAARERGVSTPRSSSSAGSSRAAGSRTSTRSRHGGPARSRLGSATSA
jgi:predicted dehydrogenase